MDVLNWRWAFFINVPISLAILAVTPLVIPAVPRRNGIQLDVPGAISVTFGLVAVVFGFTEKSLVFLMIGTAALAVFFRIERRAKAPLVAIEMLAWPSVRWGNIAVLTIFSMEAGLIYLVTIYLQKVLHLGPFATGLVFGIPGLASIVAGVVAGRIVARRGARPVLLFALLVQGGFTAPLIFLGSDPNSMWLLIPALFVGFFGHITAVVAATVAATSGIPDASKGLASGLMTTCQRVASTIGIPALAAIMVVRADLLGGIHVALASDVIFTVIAVALIAVGLKQVRPTQTGGSGPI